MLVARIGVRRAVLLGWVAIAMLTLSFIAPNSGSMLALRLAFGVGFALIVTATGPDGVVLGPGSVGGQLVEHRHPQPRCDNLGGQRGPDSAGDGLEDGFDNFGAAGVLGGAVWLALGREAPAGGPRPYPITLRRDAEVLRSRTVVLLVIADAGILVQYTALTGWLPTFYTERRGLSLSDAGFVTGVLPLVGVFAVLAGAALPLRFGSARIFFLSSGLPAGLGGLGTFLSPSIAGIYVATVALGIGSWFYIPTLLILPLRLSGITPESLGVIYGSIMTFSGFELFASPVLVGGLRDATGWFLPGFAICAAMGWTVLISGLLLPKEVARATMPQSG